MTALAITDNLNSQANCCDGTDQALDIINGEAAESVNQISATGSPDGKLCWNSTTGFSSPNVYLISFETDDLANGGVQITLTGNLTNKTFTYITTEGVCYRGELNVNAPAVNVFDRI